MSSETWLHQHFLVLNNLRALLKHHLTSVWQESGIYTLRSLSFFPHYGMEINDEQSTKMQILDHTTERFWLFFKLIHSFEKERERERTSRMGRGRGRESPKQTVHWAWSPMPGSITRPWGHDLSWNQESDTQPTVPPRHPCNIWLSDNQIIQNVHILKFWSKKHQLGSPGGSEV